MYQAEKSDACQNTRWYNAVTDLPLSDLLLLFFLFFLGFVLFYYYIIDKQRDSTIGEHKIYVHVRWRELPFAS